METGTGKTYVYLRTALELHRRYGMRKFIVVVPSVAVREGVLKTLAVTSEHLRALYDNVAYRYAVYNSANLSQVRQFALAQSVELLVMTLDSFNKAQNVIHQSTDRLQGETPVSLIRAARPVLILDEPQNMESETSLRALATLNPLCALRYSATHRNPYNLVYRLTPLDAYRQRLVKRIEVAAVVEHHDPSQAYVRLDALESQEEHAHRQSHDPQADEGRRAQGTDGHRPPRGLAGEEGRPPEYRGFEVEEIDAGDGFVRFANNVVVRLREAHGPDRAAIFRAQIRYTLEEHLRRQTKLRESGVKVLSLFFIDRVANYTGDDALLPRLFDEAFDELKARYPAWRNLAGGDVRRAYFAERRKGGASEFVDSSGKSRDDEAAYDLIMKEKERLLSFDEPVAFIFSHSALREGWDNPNVFQICTLNQTSSEVKKRQEIGRGVRLPVNQAGTRIRDDAVNVLTVVANESYETYVARLQAEIVEDYGQEGLPPAPANAREREQHTAHLNKARALSPEFQELWERIKHKTRYSVAVDTPRLIEDVLPLVDAITVKSPRLTIQRARIEVDAHDQLESHVVAEQTASYLTGRPLPNLLELIANLMQCTSPPMYLTRRTLLTILQRSTNKQAMLDNPHEFGAAFVRIVKDKLADQLAAGIHYERLDEEYEMRRLFEADEIATSSYLAARRAFGLRQSALRLAGRARLRGRAGARRPRARLYQAAGLVHRHHAHRRVQPRLGHRDARHGCPDGIDGALSARRLYLVRETKSTDDLGQLRPDERRKIDCGKRHFEDALAVSYGVATSAKELP